MKLFSQFASISKRKFSSQSRIGVHKYHTLSRVERYDGQIQDEISRRKKVFDKLPNNSVALFSANNTVYMTNDIPYAFRQNTNFYYLTGFEEPNSLCVFEKDDRGQESYHLFVMEKDPNKELWDGLRYGEEGAKQFGTDQTHSIERLSHYLPDLVDHKSAVFCDKHTSSYLASKNIPIQKKRNGDEFIEQIRVIKSDTEVKLAKKASEISNQAFRAIMRSGRKYIESNEKRTVNEHLMSSQLEWECRRLGAQRLAYPPVVAGGVRANTLHYVTNNLPISDGEMILVDGGAELHCFSSDVTRTWPINGKFTEPQKEIYEIVLRVQKECIKAAKVGNTIGMLTKLSSYLFGEELKALGVIPNHRYSSRMVSEVYPHSLGHFLGMDVHDTPSLSYSTPLQEGMYITIEPGLYMANSTIDIPDRYRGIGIRIEDNVLITKDGPEVITKDIPKEVEEIESLILS